MTTEKILGVWIQSSGVEIWEMEFNDDAHAFAIAYDGRHVVTVYADSPENTYDLREALDANEDVRDWEDGDGNNVGMLIRQRTGDGLRETLRRIEDAGTCYNDARPFLGVDGIFWHDRVNGVYYEYETDNMDLLVDDLTDEDLKNVMIGGL